MEYQPFEKVLWEVRKPLYWRSTVKSRSALLLVVLILVLCLTGCGEMNKKPQLIDVETALKDNGNIVIESSATGANVKTKKNNYTYKITINSCELNEQKNIAQVSASLEKTMAPLITTSAFDITFSLLSDGRSWKAVQVSERTAEESRVLSEKITETKANRLVKNSFFTVAGDKVYSDQIKKVEPASEDVFDKEAMTDTIRYRITADRGVNALIFDADIVFRFLPGDDVVKGSWIIQNYEVVGVDNNAGFGIGYQFDVDPKALADYIKSKDLRIEILGNTYYTRAVGIEVKNCIIVPPTLNGETVVSVPVSFDLVIYKNLTISYDSKVEFHFTTKWEPYYVTDLKVTNLAGGWSGSWMGTVINSDRSTMEVLIDIYDDINREGFPVARISVINNNEEIGNYVWEARVRNYNPEYTITAKDAEGKEKTTYYPSRLDVEFVKWEQMPVNQNQYAYKDFSGYLKDGKWIPAYKWDSFEFTRIGNVEDEYFSAEDYAVTEQGNTGNEHSAAIEYEEANIIQEGELEEQSEN